MIQTKRGLAWSGVSSKKQAENISPQEQLRLCHEHADRHGVQIVAELEVAESRSITLFEDAARRIPAYAELQRLVRGGEVDVLFCYDVGRLGRKTSLILTIIELCVEAGVLVYEIESPPRTLDDAYDYSDRIVHAIEATGYQHEVEKLKERLAYGRIGRVKAGNMPSGRPPYGYRIAVRLDGSQTVREVQIDDAAAAIVREMYRRFLAGAGLGAIADELNARGIPSPSGVRWGHVLVSDVLDRAWRYAGFGEITVTHKRGRSYVKSQGKWPPLIDVATAERIFSERAARRANRRIANTKARFSGIVWCARCQRIMHQSLPATERNGRPRFVRFYCPNPQHKNAVPTARVEAALRLALDDLAAADLSAIADGPSAALESIRQRITEQEASIKRQQARLDHAVSLAVDNLLPADVLRGQLERINAAIAVEQSALERLRAQLESEEAKGTQRARLAQIIASGYAMLTIEDTALANTWWRQFVRVWCDDDQILEVRLG